METKPDYEKKIADADDTALLVVGTSLDEPEKIIVRIDDAKSGEKLAFVKLTKLRASIIGARLIELSKKENE